MEIGDWRFSRDTVEMKGRQIGFIEFVEFIEFIELIETRDWRLENRETG